MDGPSPLLQANGPITIQPLDDCQPELTPLTSAPGWNHGTYNGASGMAHGMPYQPPLPTLPGGIQIKPEPIDHFAVSNVSVPDDSNHPQAASGAPAEKPKKVRKRKVKDEPQTEGYADNQNTTQNTNMANVKVKKEIKQEKMTDFVKPKKKRDRFKGMTEEEVLKRTLPDHLVEGLDIAIVGINPGLTAAFVGHHYAGPGNHFWKCLFLSGLIPEPMNAYDDYKLRDYGIGFTNIVERTSRGSADLSKKEIKEGGEILKEKIAKFKPKIAAFNGKGIYEVFCGHKNFVFGKQPDPFPGSTDTIVYVMPSSSARCTQLPRAVDKVPFYAGLKKIKDSLNGLCPAPDEADITFPEAVLKTAIKPKPEGDVKKEPGTEVKKEPKTKIKEEPGTGAKKPAKPRAPRKPRKSKKDAEAEKEQLSADLGGQVPPPGGAPPIGAGPVGIPPSSQGGVPVSGAPPLPQGGCMTTAGETMPSASQPMMAGAQNQPTSFLDMLFSNPSSLVKQEDSSELAQFGILPNMTFPNVSNSTAVPGTTAQAPSQSGHAIDLRRISPPHTPNSANSQSSTGSASGHFLEKTSTTAPTTTFPSAAAQSWAPSAAGAPSTTAPGWAPHMSTLQSGVGAKPPVSLARPIPQYPPAWAPSAHQSFPPHPQFQGAAPFLGQGHSFYPNQGHIPFPGQIPAMPAPGMPGFPNIKPEPSSEGYGVIPSKTASQS